MKFFNDFLKPIFKKIKIKRLLLVAYVVVPCLLVAVGFAAWAIIGNDAIGTNGGFTSYGVIASHEYITIQSVSPNDPNNYFDVYETGFIGTDGSGNPIITNNTNIGINYTMNFKKCQEDLIGTTQGSLYGVFVLSFSYQTNDVPDIFSTMTFNVEGATAKDATLNLDANAPTATVVSCVNTTISSTIVVKFDFKPKTELTYTQENAQINFIYTLSPKDNDYKDFYDYISGGKKLMIDVKITDINPVV